MVFLLFREFPDDGRPNQNQVINLPAPVNVIGGALHGLRAVSELCLTRLKDAAGFGDHLIGAVVVKKE